MLVPVTAENAATTAAISHTAVVTSAVNAANDIPAKKSNWVKVKPKRRHKRVVFGDNSNSELEVATNRKWVHVSSFKPNVTVDQILEYVEKHANVAKTNMECYKLVKKDADLNAMKRVSFKLGISPGFYNELFKPSVWPAEVQVRPFDFFQKQNRLEKNI